MNKLLIIGFLLLFCACKKASLDTYSGTNSIYFPKSEQETKTYFSYGYLSAYIQDTVIKFPVIATGAAVGYDRPYSLVVVDSTTMVKDRDYEFVNKEFVIKANKLTDTVKILVHRSTAMRQKQMQLSCSLVANEAFSTQVSYQNIGTGSAAYKRYYTHFDLYADDIAGTPWFWDKNKNKSIAFIIGYLGEYSTKKLQFMIGRYDLDPKEITKDGYNPSSLSVVAWGMGMQAYLYEMSIKGTPILEEDGTPMKMGINVQ